MVYAGIPVERRSKKNSDRASIPKVIPPGTVVAHYRGVEEREASRAAEEQERATKKLKLTEAETAAKAPSTDDPMLPATSAAILTASEPILAFTGALSPMASLVAPSTVSAPAEVSVMAGSSTSQDMVLSSSVVASAASPSGDECVITEVRQLPLTTGSDFEEVPLGPMEVDLSDAPATPIGAALPGMQFCFVAGFDSFHVFY